jgi:hypothetical protein
MDQLFIQTVINDREREVVKHVEDNQIYKQLRESAAEKQDVTEKSMNFLSSLWLTVTKHLRGVSASIPEDSVEV